MMIKPSKLYFSLLYLFWVLTVLFGNRFLKLGFSGLNSTYIIVLLAYAFAAYLFGRKIVFKKASHDRLINLGVVYIIIAVFYVALSYGLTNYGGIPFIFGIDNIDFKSSYIIRHFFPVLCIPVVMCECYYMQRLESLPFSLNLAYIVFFVLTAFDVAGFTDHPIYRLFIVNLTVYLILFSKKKLKLVCSFIAIYRIGLASSSCVLGLIIVAFVYLFQKQVIKFLSANFRWKTILLFSFLIMILPFAFDILSSVFANDGNALWRLKYWVNEIRIIGKTVGAGVGFGTAYGDYDIFTQTNNANVFVRSEYGYSMREALFNITQHSSILNQFYRVGIIGGVLFLLFNFEIWHRFASEFTRSKSLIRKKLLLCTFLGYLNSFVFIAFNPGLESPRFCICFIISLGSLLGAIYNHSLE